MSSSQVPEHVVLAVIGSGFAGIGAAIRLREEHGGSLAIFERASSVGGVWRDNTYPGAACDVESLLYSFSFAQSTRWRHKFARQREIRAHLEDTVDRHDLRRHLRLDCAVTSVTWNPATSRWTLTTAGSETTADHVVLATGSLADPAIPAIPGIDGFDGPVFHSSQWDHSVDLRGKRVAVVGTGASAIQFIPAIASDVESLVLFQRTPAWVMPRHDKAISGRTRQLLRRVPGLQKAARAAIFAHREVNLVGFRNPAVMSLVQRKAIAHLHAAVTDDRKREALTPDYRLGCKRVLLSDDYYPALAQDHVSIETDGIASVEGRQIVTVAGDRHDVDVIILGTGFHAGRLPLTDRVIDGDGVSLSEQWGASPRAHLGTMVDGFPNLYLMHGPNIALGHTSVLLMFEGQYDYIAEAMSSARRRGAAIAPSPAVVSDYSDEVDRLSRGTVWTAGGCRSWYLDETGRNSVLWPGSIAGFVRRARSFSEADHVFTPRRSIEEQSA